MSRKSLQSLLNLSELPTIDSSRFYQHARASHDNASSADPKQLPYIAALQKVQQQHLNLEAHEKSSNCRFFTRQDAAFQAFDSLEPYLQCHNKIYTYETEIQGKRQFILADNRTFIEDYFKIPLKNRHIYEIIRYTFPCRLYFDLEYHRPSNPTIDGYNLTERWIDLVIWKLSELYGIIVTKRNILVLDSTTDEKFSKHVIFSIPSHSATIAGDNNSCKEYLFQDNQEMSRVIRAILLDITKPFQENASVTVDGESLKYHNNDSNWSAVQDLALVSDGEQVIPIESKQSNFNNVEDNLFVANNQENSKLVDQTENTNNIKSDIICFIDGESRTPYAEYRCFWLQNQSSTEDNSSTVDTNRRQFFVDIGVYTKNRAFRLYGSCKHGKQKMLGIDARDEAIYYKYNNSNNSNCNASQFATLKRKDLVLRAFIVPVDLFSDKLCFRRSNNNSVVKSTDSDADLDIRATSSHVATNHDYLTFTAFENMFNSEKYLLLPRLGENCTSFAKQQAHGRKRPLCDNSSGIDDLFESRLRQRYLSRLLFPSDGLSAPNSITMNHLSSHLVHSVNNNSYSHPNVHGHMSWRQNVVLQSTSTRQSTPFAPLLDTFLLFQFAQNRGQCPSGYFSQWFIYSYKNINGVISYKLRMMIQNNRYCRVIQRPHKSNGIYIECELMTGEVRQQCWDADCQQIRHRQKRAAHKNVNDEDEAFHLPRGLIAETPEEIIRIVEQAAMVLKTAK